MPSNQLPSWRADALRCATVIAIIVAGGFLVTPTTPAPARVLVVGDSNACATGVAARQSWPVRLERKLNTVVQVYGMPGASLSTPLSQITDPPACLQHLNGYFHVDAAVLALGTNDLGSTADNVRAATARTLTSIPVPWICLTPPRRTDGYEPQLAPMRAVIAEECLAHGAVVLDGAQVAGGTGDLQGDGVHLSVVGHLRVMRAVLRAIEQIHAARAVSY